MKQPAIIFDRDGTLASVAWCAPRDRHDNEQWRVFNGLLLFDPPVREIVALMRSIRPGVTRIVVSGRRAGDYAGDLSRHFQIRDWLVKHHIPFDHLITRPACDLRVDSEVKREIYWIQIEPHYDVRYVVDDRPQVVEMWRSLGLPVLHVQDPGLRPEILGSL